MTKTLAQLIDEYGANAVVITDRGNGAGYDQAGEAIMLDLEGRADARSEYGHVEMHKLDAPCLSADGMIYEYASDWIDRSDLNDGYEVRVYF